MPRFSEADFDVKMSEVRDYLIEQCSKKKVPLDKLAAAATSVGEMDPALYTFDDGGNAARQQFRILLQNSGMTFQEVSAVEDIFTAIHDLFGELIGSLTYNTFIPGPTYDDPPPDWSESIEWSKNEPMVLGDFDYENILGEMDDDETEVLGHRFVNPCMVTVIGPTGAPVDYALPGWSCVLAGIIVVAGALGDSALSFLDRVADGFKKAGRGLKKLGKKISKALGF